MPSDSLRDSADRGGDAPGSRTSRRVVLKAVAGLSAIAASGISAVPTLQQRAQAQDTGGTRATRFVPSEAGITPAAAAAGEWASFQAEYPFWALGASWNGDVGEWPVIAVQLSADGSTWTDTIELTAYTDDGGQPNRDERLFTALMFTDGPQWVRYQTLDADGNPGEVAGLSFVYIDPTDGPWAEDIVPEQPSVGAEARLAPETIAPPEIVTRAQWGANESWRFDTIGEIWPPEYETVSHIIIHHTATQNQPVDVPGAIRSIYYYHAIEQGWGDIGYNYLVDHKGRIYQGRYGGQNVIGGHSYQFAVGSSGISTIGNFMSVEPTDAAKSALTSICAWVGRDLDPLGKADFHEAPDLPIIASHRDVNATTCPGDRLWNDLPALRQLVADTLDSGALETSFPAGIVPGDRVKVQTDDGSDIILRSSDGGTGTVVGTLAQGELAWVTDGPTKTSNGNWYRIKAVSGNLEGWATAQYLIVDPPLPPGSPGQDYPFGLNVRTNATANMRRSPSQSAGLVASLPSGTWAYILAGPESSEGWDWYQIHTSSAGEGWVITTALSPSPVDSNPPATFAVGDTVRATSSSTIRPRPGIAQKTIASVASGAQMVISQAPIAVTDYTWYGVYSTAFGGGWITSDVLAASTPTGPGKFAINDTIKVTSSTNLRATPSTSGSVLVTMATGTTATVIGGPRAANGYTWWNVRLANGTSGWCIENWLQKTDVTTPPPGSTKFKVNDTFKVLETTNLRSSATTSAGVVSTMSPGTTGTVIGGPKAANGYNWWQVRLANGTSGWSIENWLQKTDVTTPPPGSTKFKVNDTFRVSDTMNMRSAASTSASVVASLPAGTTGTVIGGPTAANGYNWWQLRTSGGTTGWAAENWLVNTTGTTPPPPSGKFAVGDAVNVTERANLRSAAGTSASVIRGVTVGESGTIKSGPTTATGYTWWQVQFSSGSGWIIEDVLAKGASTPPPSDGTFPAGTTVKTTTSNLRMRSSASTSASVRYALPLGTRLTVVSGPVSGSGYTWYEVRSSTYGTGFVVKDYIVRV